VTHHDLAPAQRLALKTRGATSPQPLRQVYQRRARASGGRAITSPSLQENAAANSGNDETERATEREHLYGSAPTLGHLANSRGARNNTSPSSRFRGAPRPHPFKSQHWVQLNNVRRGANLTMVTIEKTNPGHSNYDWLIGRIRLG
jgi:hypothetical protein